MTVGDLLTYRRRGSTVAVATAGVAAVVGAGFRLAGGGDLGPEAPFWMGMLVAAWVCIRSLDLGLLSGDSSRLVTLGVEAGEVGRYHVALALRTAGGASLIALGAASPWLAGLPPAELVSAGLLLALPGPFAAVVSVSAHIHAGEALEEGRGEGLKRALGGKFGAAEAAPLLYSAGGALAVAGVGAVLLSASLRDLVAGRPAGPLWVVLGGHVVVAAVAARRAVQAYERSFTAVVPRILEVAAPAGGGWTGGPAATTPTARLLSRLPGLAGAVAWRDALQVRRAHRIDGLVRGAAVGVALLLAGKAPPPWAVAAAWGVVVAVLAPVARAAGRPPLAPPALEGALALPRLGGPGAASLIVAAAWDLPVAVALGLAFGAAAGVAAFLASVAVHAAGRALP